MAKKTDTVTVPAEEFEQMKQQMALLSKFMTSDAKAKTAAERKEAKEERLIELTLRGNAKGMERVTVYIDKGNRWGNKNAEVSINGVQYVIPKGRNVKIPRCVAEVIENAEKQINRAYDMQDEKAAEFEKAQTMGAFASGYAVGG